MHFTHVSPNPILLVVILFDGHLFGIALSTSMSAIFGFIVLILHFKHGSSIKFNPHGVQLTNMYEVAQCGIVLAAHSLLQNIKVMPNCVVMAIGTTTIPIVGCAYILTKYFGAIGLWMSYPLSEILFMLSLFIIDAVRCKRLPHSLNELLFLNDQFDGENVKM